LKVVADTGPLLAATDTADQANELAAKLVGELARDLLVPSPVMVEVDYMLRTRVGTSAARSFLAALAAGEHSPVFLTPNLLARAVEIDAQFADLNLGLVDASVMAYAERHELPILTFDFRDFRASAPAEGRWQLLVDEDQYERFS
jgi:predicted nucleic acid-binding protein